MTHISSTIYIAMIAFVTTLLFARLHVLPGAIFFLLYLLVADDILNKGFFGHLLSRGSA